MKKFIQLKQTIPEMSPEFRDLVFPLVNIGAKYINPTNVSKKFVPTPNLNTWPKIAARCRTCKIGYSPILKPTSAKEEHKNLCHACEESLVAKEKITNSICVEETANREKPAQPRIIFVDLNQEPPHEEAGEDVIYHPYKSSWDVTVVDPIVQVVATLPEKEEPTKRLWTPKLIKKSYKRRGERELRALLKMMDNFPF